MEKYDAILVDAGTGNLHSVYNALKSLGANILVTSIPDQVQPGERIILPGVGAFAAFMQGIEQKGLFAPLRAAFQAGSQILGICVGMQSLFELSEEMGSHNGLGFIRGKVTRFPNFKELKVPHTGWNQLWFQNHSPLFFGLQPGCFTYFNHGYYCSPNDTAHSCAFTDYGIQFTSAVRSGNLYGVQFHPEKSQKVGLQILSNFLRI
jgi:glutamine amidotransferase